MFKNKYSFLFLLFILFSLRSFSIFAEPALAGAELPYAADWYRNPAIQSNEPPCQVFSPQVVTPLGWLKLFNPNTFPYELLNGEINSELDFDLLSSYIQLSNPFILIINPPESPDEIKVSVSQEKIQISDESSSPLSINCIPGLEAFSVNRTPLIPPPLFSFHTRFDNIFLGAGIFGGTSGLSFFFNNKIVSLLSVPEVVPEDTLSVRAEISARTGIFEYINIIAKPVYLFDIIKFELAGRIFFYQTLAEVRGAASIDINIAEDYVLSEFGTNLELFYLYPSEGIGAGARLDLGSLFKANEFTFGISLLNVLGIEYSTGLKLKEDDFIESTNFYSPVRPYCLFHCSYLYEINDDFILIPIIDLGFGKTLFAHAAIASFWNNMSFKMGIAFENRIKGSIAAGIKLGWFLFESGVIIQQSVFDHILTGLFLSLGLSK